MSTLQKSIEDAFYLFAYDDKMISTREVGPVIRSVGLNPTEEEVQQICQEVERKGSGGKIDAAGLAAILEPRAKALVTPENELKEALLALDKSGTNTLYIQDLVHALTSLGERLKPETVDEFVREVDRDGEGQVSISEVINILLK